ncbi:uncharacterized protein LOC123670459 [Melitaea cinxia]|uniref:uncharacterized protein LOC123670459 n=1 Tax=Melitaea cinxia TaxID=113334 RepID=UPI001E2741BF|nr:uncharacterized protein LOC123670459 [Melitaea cinxia]
MITIAFLAVVACASAAPHFRHHYSHRPFYQEPFYQEPFSYDSESSLERFMDSQMFDTRGFWEELSREMMGLNAMIEDLYKRFPTNLSEEKVEGNKYKINIALSGFVENEIVVKAKKGLLIIQAVHEAEHEPGKSYLDVRTLPDVVDVNGSWTYENGLLKIVFPLEHKSEVEPAVTEVPVTQAPEHSRESVEFDMKTSGIQDADVGATKRVTAEDNSISTNEIPQVQTVEATTYAVDLKGEVELVPVVY